ncbi:hypothetical protein SCP_0602320 [Sparassis crispa]|uniref:Uncharacterized protein n=1 Tax=Sparassis crispa TaxID=139825 RepID=A0A401GRA8_9APHY|nr:hypothetical protein SCP_0602320 [Sparassis crispa]GBE84254.1 hypothetical protein SCP_0602320 [Sparassis crispa]
MAPPTWANTAESEWLQEQLPHFLDHQKCKKLQTFYRTLYTEWDTQFQEHARLFLDVDLMVQLTPEQDAELTQVIAKWQKQLYNWYNNRKPKGRSADKTAASILKNFIPKGAVPVKHLPQVVKAYSHKYYKEKIKKDVDLEIKEKNLKKGEALPVIRRLTQAAYDAEMPEVKAETIADVEQKKAEREAEEAQTEEVHSQDEYSPTEYQKMLDCMPAAFDQFLGAMSKSTSWRFSVFGGGPSPEDGGNLRLMFHSGDGPNVLKFSDTIPNFKTQFMESFGQFLAMSYSLADCQRRTLPSSLTPGSSEPPPEVTALNLEDLCSRMEDSPDAEDPIIRGQASSSPSPSPDQGTPASDAASADVSDAHMPVTAAGPPPSSEDGCPPTTVNYAPQSSSATPPSIHTRASPVPASFQNHLPASANAALSWAPNLAAWQFDVPAPAFDLDADLQPISLDDVMLGIELDRMVPVSPVTGMLNFQPLMHINVPSGPGGSQLDVGDPGVSSSNTDPSCSPVFALCSPSNPQLVPEAPSSSLVQSTPSSTSPSLAASSPGAGSLPSLSPHGSSLTSPSLAEPTTCLLSLAADLPSFSVESAPTPSTVLPVRTTAASSPSACINVVSSPADEDAAPVPACKHRPATRKHLNPVLPALMEAANAEMESGTLSSKSGCPARTRVAPKQADANWSRSGKQQPIIASGWENRESEPATLRRGKWGADGQQSGPATKRKRY